MKTKNLRVSKHDSWALPGDPITLEEFKKGIKEAEKGPFYSVGESKKTIEEWRRRRSSR